MRTRRSVRLACRAAVVIACGAACASCAEDYLVRRDTLALGEGDAVRADMARQVIDPWPRAAFDETIDSNGERLQHAMERYRNPSTNVPGSNPSANAPALGANPPASPVPVVN